MEGRGERRRCEVHVTQHAHHLDVRLGAGFDESDLALVRGLPGRRWNQDRQVWTVP